MLRHALSVNARHFAQRRGFVSTVLLTRDWENETTSALRKEAKKRGLLQNGNKATLITRLQQYEREQAMQNPTPVTPPQQQTRQASTVEVKQQPKTEVPGVPSSSKPTSIPSSYPVEFLDVKLPNLSQPPPEVPVQIPFVPDLWESSKIKAESAPAQPEEPVIPKVLSVAGAGNVQSAGISQQLHHELPAALSSSGKKGFFRELISEYIPDVELPSKNIPQELLEGVAETTQTSGKSEPSSRTLDKEERAGVWALVGLLAGSWVVAGVLSPKSSIAEPEHHKSVPEKTAESL